MLDLSVLALVAWCSNGKFGDNIYFLKKHLYEVDRGGVYVLPFPRKLPVSRIFHSQGYISVRPDIHDRTWSQHGNVDTFCVVLFLIQIYRGL